MSAHINAYIVEAIIPPRTLGVHRVNNGRSISHMCSRNVSNAKSCVPHLDQHIVSLGRLRALCRIWTNRQGHQRTPPSNPQLVDAAVLMAHLDMIDR
ncbi:hypothetical protein HPB49_006831 [Dermacentor silvarum]|uniref:Uncharacterized protein n=1 Tax=Dermacentor silvarum TaxID=543639 RepID=A0ACB8CJU7_DERSI|nr:hypothetical protein HPB49_006831 [Dermacentor silvarum]